MAAGIPRHLWNSPLPRMAVLARYAANRRHLKFLAQDKARKEAILIDLIRHYKAEFFRWGMLATWAKRADLQYSTVYRLALGIVRTYPQFMTYKIQGRKLKGITIDCHPKHIPCPLLPLPEP